MSRYYLTQEDYLMHHGVKGQKWGRRQYQNEDGSLTELGRQHYGYGTGKKALFSGQAAGAKNSKRAVSLNNEYARTKGNLHLMSAGLGRGMGVHPVGAAFQYYSARKNAKQGVEKETARDIAEFGNRVTRKINRRARENGTSLVEERKKARGHQIRNMAILGAASGAISGGMNAYILSGGNIAKTLASSLAGAAGGAAGGALGGAINVGLNYVKSNAVTNLAYRDIVNGKRVSTNKDQLKDTKESYKKKDKEIQDRYYKQIENLEKGYKRGQMLSEEDQRKELEYDRAAQEAWAKNKEDYQKRVKEIRNR